MGDLRNIVARGGFEIPARVLPDDLILAIEKAKIPIDNRTVQASIHLLKLSTVEQVRKSGWQNLQPLSKNQLIFTYSRLGYTGYMLVNATTNEVKIQEKDLFGRGSNKTIIIKLDDELVDAIVAAINQDQYITPKPAQETAPLKPGEKPKPPFDNAKFERHRQTILRNARCHRADLLECRVDALKKEMHRSRQPRPSVHPL